MTIDYASLLYNPVYDILGVPAVLHGVLGLGFLDLDIVAIDKTSGVTLQQAVDVQTVHPAVSVKSADLVAAGVALVDIDGKTLTINGKDWRVASILEKPSPNGEAEGEIYLLLEDVS